MPLISSFYGMYINLQDFSCLLENWPFLSCLLENRPFLSCLLENRPFLPKTLKAFQKQRFIL